MSRHKIVSAPDAKYLKKRKRHIIMRAVDISFAALGLLGLLIAAAFKEHTLTGPIILITEGLLFIVASIFYTWTLINGWYPLFYFDGPKNRSLYDKATEEEYQRDHRETMIVILAIFYIASISLIVIGAIKLISCFQI